MPQCGPGLQKDADIIYFVWTTRVFDDHQKYNNKTLSVQDNEGTLEIISINNQFFKLYWLQFPFFFKKALNLLVLQCVVLSFRIKFVKPECLNRKGTDHYNFGRYVYPSSSWGTIKTNMTIQCCMNKCQVK